MDKVLAIFRIPELRQKLWVTLGLLFVCMNAAYWRQSERRRSGRRADERS